MPIIDTFKLTNMKGRIFWLAVLLLVATVAVYYFYFVRGSGTVTYATAQVTQGSLINKVSSTGTLQAVTTVQVGSQASGTISALYVDFNSEVHKGQVIAELDPLPLKAQVQQAQANLDQSSASLKVAQANLSNAKAQLSAARSNVLNQKAGVSSAQGNLNSLKAQSDDALSLLNKQQALFNEGIIAQRDLEVAQTGYKSAQAKYEQALAQVNQATITETSANSSGIAQATAAVEQMESQVLVTKAQIKQASAALSLAKINLSHTTITSPINGVVVSRQIDVGQTVAASLSAPTLFTIANDLTQMQVIANIDEADIGSINNTNKVNFTVDAFPGQTFVGKINQIRLNAQTVSNVVTYNVVVNVDNPDQKLKPGMTADLTFVIDQRENVIKIPNSAFRFAPDRGSRPARNAGGNANDQNSSKVMQDQAGENRSVSSPTTPVLPGQTRIVWTLTQNNNLQRHEVKIGITDGSFTEMVEGDLKQGDMLVTSETTSGTARASNTQSAPGFGGSTGGGRPPGR